MKKCVDELKSHNFYVIYEKYEKENYVFTCKCRKIPILCTITYDGQGYKLKNFALSNKKLVVESIDTTQIMEFTNIKQIHIPFTSDRI